MTFIIALGVIIVLLCSASIFKLIQPKHPTEKRAKRRAEAPLSAPKKIIKSKPLMSRSRLDTMQEEDGAEESVMTGGDGDGEHSPEADVFLTPHKSPVLAVPSHPKKAVPELISLNLCAQMDRPYAGYELLQALLSCGMRFGTMNIFHRHEKKTGLGPIYFSLASCTREGTFDLSKIGAFSCNGLVLFMKPKEVDEPVKVFEMMLDTADQLISDLGGKVLNAKQQLLKKEDVLELHQQLRHYVQELKTMDLS